MFPLLAVFCRSSRVTRVGSDQWAVGSDQWPVASRKPFSALIAVVALVAGTVLAAFGQTAPPQQNPPQQNPPQQTTPQKPASPGEAGGPTGDVGPIAIPKKTPEDSTSKPVPRRPVNEKTPEYTITTNVPLVNLDVLVTTKDGQFVPGLKKDMFKVYEDGVPQTISNFGTTQAPITAVMLIEFANTAHIAFERDWLIGAYSFAQTLKKDDWVAVVAYDMKPEILVDFTQDKGQVMSAINRLRIPGFSETNEFDALYDTLDRIDGIDGRKYVILISSGCDSFSKMTYDKILKKIRDTKNVTIFPISTGQALRLWAESAGYMGMLTCSGNALAGGNMNRLDYLQADNEMNTFARMTGGRAYFPRFEAEFPEIAADINNSIRNEYSIGYHPTNPKLDGTYRKLKVELVGPDGKPLKMFDQKHKELKYQIIAREGYTAKHTVD